MPRPLTTRVAYGATPSRAWPGGTKATATLLAEGAAGYQLNHRTGEVTLMVRVSGEGSGELSTLLGGVQGEAGGEGTVAVTLDSSGQPAHVRARHLGAGR